MRPRPSDPSIAFVTRNGAKYARAADVLAKADISLRWAAVEVPEVQDDSVRNVAIAKARSAAALVRPPLLIEDSGLYLDDLNGFPGPYVKYVLKTLGVEGFGRLLSGLERRGGCLASVLVYVDPDHKSHVFENEATRVTLAPVPTSGTVTDGGWSELWRLLIPEGESLAWPALPLDRRKAIVARWQERSVFQLFASWYRESG